MPLERRRLLHLIAAGGLATAGCMSDGDAGGESSPTPSSSAATDTPTTTETEGSRTAPPGETTRSIDRTIDMAGSTYQPVRETVAVGSTVAWRNRDGVAHTVTSAQFHETATAWSFDERAAGGERIVYTFDSAGVYEYYCTIHGQGQMCGVVLVGDVSLSASLPCEDDAGGAY